MGFGVDSKASYLEVEECVSDPTMALSCFFWKVMPSVPADACYWEVYLDYDLDNLYVSPETSLNVRRALYDDCGEQLFSLLSGTVSLLARAGILDDCCIAVFECVDVKAVFWYLFCETWLLCLRAKTYASLSAAAMDTFLFII